MMSPAVLGRLLTVLHTPRSVNLPRRFSLLGGISAALIAQSIREFGVQPQPWVGIPRLPPIDRRIVMSKLIITTVLAFAALAVVANSAEAAGRRDFVQQPIQRRATSVH